MNNRLRTLTVLMLTLPTVSATAANPYQERVTTAFEMEGGLSGIAYELPKLSGKTLQELTRKKPLETSTRFSIQSADIIENGLGCNLAIEMWLESGRYIKYELLVGRQDDGNFAFTKLHNAMGKDPAPTGLPLADNGDVYRTRGLSLVISRVPGASGADEAQFLVRGIRKTLNGNESLDGTTFTDATRITGVKVGRACFELGADGEKEKGARFRTRFNNIVIRK